MVLLDYDDKTLVGKVLKVGVYPTFELVLQSDYFEPPEFLLIYGFMGLYTILSGWIFQIFIMSVWDCKKCSWHAPWVYRDGIYTKLYIW